MEYLGTPNNQNNLEKEQRCKTPDFRTYYKATVIKPCGTRIKIDI